jgi:hypothetical protein
MSESEDILKKLRDFLDKISIEIAEARKILRGEN